MSVGILIRFLAGRYHATPWDHQVNEGVVEWPPTPWRILRSLVSAYYRLPEPPVRNQVCQLVTRLAEHLPSYVLPSCTIAHTRHYMPVWKEGKATTTKVFDTFMVLGGGTLSPDAEVKVVWPDLRLSEEETQLLQQLCCQVSYLGRAESWAELSVIDADISLCNAVPASSEDSGGWKKQKVKVLAPLTSEGLEGFRAAITALPKPKRGKAKWKAPTDLLEALELDIAYLHSQSWNGIPGTRWVTYEVKQVERSLRPQNLSIYASSKVPTFARFALVSNVLPNLTEAVSVGERFRQALMKWSRDESGKADPVFSGRDEEGDYRKDNHQHAWYLPEVNKEGKIDHVVVYAPEGFSSINAIFALQNLRKVWGSEGFDLQTVLVSLGKVEDYCADAKDADRGGRSLIIGKGRKWRSLTPLVLPRHPKRNRRQEPKIDPKTDFQIDGPEQQALRLLKQLKSSIPVNGCFDAKCPDRDGNNWLGWIGPDGKVLLKVRCLVDEKVKEFRYRCQDFQRRRYHGAGDKGLDRGFWIELEFEESQQGPMALGYAAHFGLGVFIPVD